MARIESDVCQSYTRLDPTEFQTVSTSEPVHKTRVLGKENQIMKDFNGTISREIHQQLSHPEERNHSERELFLRRNIVEKSSGLS